jgi:hypothetical protein
MRPSGGRHRTDGLRRRLEAECGRPGGGPGRGSLRDRQDREELPQVDVDPGHRPDDEPLGAECDATFGPGKTATGKREIRAWWKKSKAFLPTTHWISDTPAYKVRATANGDRGTLTFECHFIDVDKQNHIIPTAADIEVAKVNGHWLITRLIAGSAPKLGASGS